MSEEPFSNGSEPATRGEKFVIAAVICGIGVFAVLMGASIANRPSTLPLLPTPGESITWGEEGACYTLDAVQPSSDGVAWVWMHRCGRPSEKPTLLTAEEWRRYARPRTTSPSHVED